METTTMKTVSAALKLVDAKKENLRKAFEDLQSYSSSSSFLNITWSDIDSHFTSLQSSLENEFQLLQEQQQLPHSHQLEPPPNKPQPQPSSKPLPIQPQSRPSNKLPPNPRRSPSAIVLNVGSDAVNVRSELKLLCEKMDGVGLRNYITEKYTECIEIRAELAVALGYALDAGTMVLDAIEGCYLEDGDARRSCVALLDLLVELKPEIRDEVKERAKKLAEEWRGKVSVDGLNPMEAFAFLNLVAAFGLVDEFNTEDIIDFAVVAASNEQATEFLLVLGLGHRISGELFPYQYLFTDSSVCERFARTAQPNTDQVAHTMSLSMDEPELVDIGKIGNQQNTIQATEGPINSNVNKRKKRVDPKPYTTKLKQQQSRDKGNTAEGRDQISFRICYKCHQQGHMKSNCPNIADPNSLRTCKVNKSKEQVAPKPSITKLKQQSGDEWNTVEGQDQISSITCFKCGQQGHIKFNCPNIAEPKSLRTCFRCHQKGHMASKCPNNART